MKKISSVVAVLFALAASPAAAQGAYPMPTSVGGCIGLSRNLSSGMRGADVRSLQQFLLERNYPGSGQWMVTGFYGRATQAAVRNFQGAQGLSQTGMVDGNTRLAVDRVSCASSALNTNAMPSPSYGAPSYTPALPVGGSYSNGYAGIGNIYAYPLNNTTFTPVSHYNYTCGNSTGFLGENTNSCPCYSQNTSGRGYPVSVSDCRSNAALAITALNPADGAIGASITIFGAGFSTNNNTVRFGSGIITGLNSADGRSVSFVIPTQLSGYGSQIVTLGTYYVSVSNSSGATSNTLPFTITSLGPTATPSITNVSGPNVLSVGTAGQWILTLNNPSGSTYTNVKVNWGDVPVNLATVSNPQQIFGTGTQTLNLSHTYSQAGNYTIQFTVSNGSGQSTLATQTVTVTGNGGTGSLSLGSMAPEVGHVGSLVVLTGSGFAQDNTVHFGIGGTQHVPSWNGTTIYYTVPQYLSPCDVSAQGSACALYLQQVTPGQYPISVTSANGSTHILYFQVQ